MECEIVNNEWKQEHLAWHETLELHELVASQSANLAAFKKKLPMVMDPELKALYAETIKTLEHNIRELLKFYPLAPGMARNVSPDMTGFDAANLLGFAKASVRNYANAITETATPQLKETFQKHLLGAIALHTKIFNFMYQHGYYPAYNLEELLAHDVQMANQALNM
ncbi:spore coat protein [Paenibacillus macerans]|uniref:spore coat protein n=1 Tax=Paenibacillus sp. FSL R5-0527 TaxID=2975321 RepID=UPI00097A2CF1|nr:spore coat protein [Paenibacillus macerans]